MESSRYIIWIKRFLPLVVLLAVWQGWDAYDQHQLKQELAVDKRMAAATVYMYLGATKFRADSLAYIDYRDSVLESMGVTPEELRQYAEGDSLDPIRYKRYVKLLGEMGDSLYRVEDSIRKAADTTNIDTALIDSLAQAMKTDQTPITAKPRR